MKTIIYYFTGTGNSLSAAKEIAALLGSCELVPIASFRDTPGDIRPDADRVGIVAPVYDMGLPSIVAEFAKRLDLSKSGYSFCILTSGGFGASALHQMNGIVKNKNRLPLDAAWAVPMVGNFVPLYSPPAGKKRETLLLEAGIRLQKIARLIERGIAVRPKFSPFSSLLKSLMYNGFIRQIHESDRQFIADENCTRCGTCSQACPVQNIVMVEERPAWQHHCELCMACLNLCPAKAIQWGPKTRGRGRYRHPDLELADMKRQAGR